MKVVEDFIMKEKCEVRPTLECCKKVGVEECKFVEEKVCDDRRDAPDQRPTEQVCEETTVPNCTVTKQRLCNGFIPASPRIDGDEGLAQRPPLPPVRERLGE